MVRDIKFWLSMAVFQILFGFAVFAITRDYYRQEPVRVTAHPATLSPSASPWQGISESDISRLAPQVIGESNIEDPVEISRRANQFFGNRQYEQAANSYEKLLAFDPKNVEVLNNLGLTLHYIGRSDEALRRLNDGVAASPDNQRIWLTLGYVNSQLGNVEEARSALAKAAEIGDNASIRQSALKMLDSLP